MPLRRRRDRGGHPRPPLFFAGRRGRDGGRREPLCRSPPSAPATCARPAIVERKRAGHPPIRPRRSRPSSPMAAPWTAPRGASRCGCSTFPSRNTVTGRAAAPRPRHCRTDAMIPPFRPITLLALLALLAAAAGCGRLAEVGRAPEFQSPVNGNEIHAMNTVAFPAERATPPGRAEASLWRAGRQSLLGDRRARARGDILTVVIEIDDSASILQRLRTRALRLGTDGAAAIPRPAAGHRPTPARGRQHGRGRFGQRLQRLLRLGFGPPQRGIDACASRPP